MKLFRKKNSCPKPELISAVRETDRLFSLPETVQPFEKELFDRLRYSVPIIDSAIMKIIRLTGGFRLICSDENFQSELDDFCNNVPVGLTGKSLSNFVDNFLDSLLTYGSAVGEIVNDTETMNIAGLWNGDVSKIKVTSDSSPFIRSYAVRDSDGTLRRVKNPENIVYSSLTGGHSLLRGLPALSTVLMKIYRCISENFDRAGNIRYAVTYKPDKDDLTNARERASQIAKEWSDGMRSSKYGQVKDFVAVGDIDIKVIGARETNSRTDSLKAVNSAVPSRTELELNGENVLSAG